MTITRRIFVALALATAVVGCVRDRDRKQPLAANAPVWGAVTYGQFTWGKPCDC